MKTLQDLLDAMKADATVDVTAFVDNDDVSFYAGNEHVLSLHPHDVQVQALAALGITAESV